MLDLRRWSATLAMSLAFASPALAQIGSPLTTGFETSRPAARPLPKFSMNSGDLRYVGAPPSNGLIAAVPLRRDLQIGLGRFRVAEPARPRTHMEPERAPTDLRRRERGVAAVGMSLRF